MDATPLLGTALLMLAACAPAGEEPPPAANEAAAGAPEGLDVAPVPDVDPETGIDRNVTYEPEIGPEPKERPRNEPRESAER